MSVGLLLIFHHWYGGSDDAVWKKMFPEENDPCRKSGIYVLFDYMLHGAGVFNYLHLPKNCSVLGKYARSVDYLGEGSHGFILLRQQLEDQSKTVTDRVFSSQWVFVVWSRTMLPDKGL